MAQATASLEGDLDPWVVAKDRYLADLDADERALFDEATIENIFYKTSNEARDERKRMTSSAIRKLQPLVVALKDYGEALDVYTNISPLPLAPVWGSIRILLVLAEKHDKYYNRITDVLGRIGDLLPRFKDYGRIFDLKRHPRLRQALSETYFDIITLCLKFREILKSQTRVSLKRFSRPLLLDVQYEDALEQFRNHKKTVEKEAGTCHMIEAAANRALALRNQELLDIKEKAERRKALFSRLSSIDYESKQKKLRSIRYGNTGTWLETEPVFRAWVDYDGAALLCCYGIPGCGKSVLTSSIIDALTISKSNTVAYYFCDYVDKRTLDPLAIWGTITRQLLEIREMPPTIENRLEKNFGDDKTPDLHALREVLSAVIRLFPTTTIVLDGIDEIDDANQKAFYSTLNKLIQETGPALKLLVSCRDDATHALRNTAKMSFRVHLQPSNIALDIEDYIRHTIEALLESGELVIQDSLLQEVTIETLIKGAQGMFLWVKFQLDDLCEAESDAEIKRVLKNLPKDLSETYARLLGKITGSQRRALAKRMFQWIICARRPLHVEELREGIAFTIGDKFFDREKLPTDMSRLIRGCGNLVVVDEDTQHVHLAHYTVQQYILLEGDASSDPCQAFCFTYTEANNTIGETCVVYLSFSDFERQVSTAINRNMLELAVLHEAVATRTTANLGRLGNTMRQALAIVQTNNTSSAIDSLKINYQRLLPNRGPSSIALLNSYLLLSYTIDYWLSHTTTSLFLASRAWPLLQALVVEKQLPFTFRPWNLGEDTGDSNHLCLLGWALEHNHVLVLRAISDSPSGCLRGKALQTLIMACDAAKSSNLMNHVSSAYMNTLDRLAQLRSFPREKEKLTWLYSKLVLACRQGNLNIIRYCFDDLWNHDGVTQSRSSNDEITFAFNHLLFEAAGYGHLDLVTWITAEQRSATLLHTSFKKECLLMENWEEACSVLDVTLLRGYPNIATLLRKKFFRVASIFDILSNPHVMSGLLENLATVDAILDVLPSAIKNIHQKDSLLLFHYRALSQAVLGGDRLRTSRYLRNFNLEQVIGPESKKPLSIAIAEKNSILAGLLIEAGARSEVFVDQFCSDIEAPHAGSEFLDAILEEMIPRATWESATLKAILNILESRNLQALQSINRIAHRYAFKKVNESRQNQLIKPTHIVKPYQNRFTPLMRAQSNTDPILIKVLIAAAEGLDKISWDVDHAVWFAIDKDNLECLRSLTEVGAELTTRDRDSLSTLEYSARKSRWNIFFFLLHMSHLGPMIPCSEFWLKVGMDHEGADRMLSLKL